jgi:hypothetical protein
MSRSTETYVISHWHTLIEGFSTSALDFYELVKTGIARREIPDLKIAQVEWKESGLGSGKRVYLRVSREHLNFDICAAPFGTGYFFSWWLARIPLVLLDMLFLFLVLVASGAVMRVLLYIASKEEQGAIAGCFGAFFGVFMFLAMLFGLGAAVRYGNIGAEPTVLSMPITGFLYGLVYRPVTYFNEDTALMFRESVHNAVAEAVDAVTSAQGVRGLSEEARKVTWKPEGKKG